MSLNYCECCERRIIEPKIYYGLNKLIELYCEHCGEFLDDNREELEEYGDYRE